MDKSTSQILPRPINSLDDEMERWRELYDLLPSTSSTRRDARQVVKVAWAERHGFSAEVHVFGWGRVLNHVVCTTCGHRLRANQGARQSQHARKHERGEL